MLIRDYLSAKYGVRKATTMLYCEAKSFGIPYPLPSGWLEKYGGIEITTEVLRALRDALQKSSKPTAKDGLAVLERAHIELSRAPSASDKEFLDSKAWKRLRFQALKRHGSRCQCCGGSAEEGARLNVDHIMPRRLFPALALQLENLQVLCSQCNEGKGNWDMTDFRQSERLSE